MIKIIAEIGVNHNGSIDRAKELIVAAKKSGADIVKFQTFKANENISKFADMADYQKRNTQSRKSQLELIEKYELSDKEFIEIYKFCNLQNIGFLSTAFDINALKFLDQFDMPFIKIPSGEITNLPLLNEIGLRNKKVLLSTGMSEIFEIKKAIEILIEAGQRKSKITVLQCTSQYPAPDHTVNLRSMLTMSKEFNIPYGFSDHSHGITASIAAAALGASVIEKHITLDKSADGPDHKASIEIVELETMCKEIHRVINILGDGQKKVEEEEKTTRLVARKSIVASQNLKKGHALTYNDVSVKRPGTGISPLILPEIIGLKLTRDVKADEVLKDSDIQI